MLSFPITICGIDEIPDLPLERISHVVSILDPRREELEHFNRHDPSRVFRFRFDDIIAVRAGQVEPTAAHVAEILAIGDRLREVPADHLLIHCHAGVSRSTATAAILMAQRYPDRLDEVFASLREVRPRSWPNSLMIRLADTMLGLDGAFMAALRRHYRIVGRAYPDLVQGILAGDRAPEVPDGL
ncbi:MAG TPA: protein-tyrosine-phosphatase [Azospirillaceae bacterium]|nr:protein-tyrosine-phosphatase [Azospirillaceae bacterium]